MHVIMALDEKKTTEQGKTWNFWAAMFLDALIRQENEFGRSGIKKLFWLLILLGSFAIPYLYIITAIIYFVVVFIQPKLESLPLEEVEKEVSHIEYLLNAIRKSVERNEISKTAYHALRKKYEKRKEELLSLEKEPSPIFSPPEERIDISKEILKATNCSGKCLISSFRSKPA